jgi:ankyrin repeat protein
MTVKFLMSDAAVKLLLETGKVEVDRKNSHNETPLWIAAKNGHEAIAKLLLETGKIAVHAKDDHGRSAK